MSDPTLMERARACLTAMRDPSEEAREAKQVIHDLIVALNEARKAESERDELLYAVGRAVLPDMNVHGRTYPWVKTAIAEIEELGKARKVLEALGKDRLVAAAIRAALGDHSAPNHSSP